MIAIWLQKQIKQQHIVKLLQANQATTYKKTEVDSNLALKRDKLTFPSSEGFTGWGAIADATSIVRRLVGAPPVRTFIDLHLDTPVSNNDVQVGLDMDVTGLTD